MTDRFPLIVDPSTQRVKELASGDNLDLTGSGIVADVFTVDTNSQERLRLDISGRMGLGTSSPSALLHCDYTGTRVGSVVGHIATTVHGDASDYALFKVSNFQDLVENVKLYVQGDGNVGINTTSPSQRLNLNIGSDQTWLQIDKTRAADEAMIQLVHSATNRGSKIRYANADSSWVVGIDGSESFVFTSGEVATGGGGFERMRIDSSGRMGLGTSSPDLKLEVSGGQNQTANQFTDLFRVAANANNDAADAEVQLNFGISPSHTDTANRQARIQAQTGGGTGRDLLINPAGGNVGIDVTVPSSLLSLGNAVSAQKLLVYENPGTNNSKYGFGIQSGEFRSFYPSDGIATFGTISTGDGSTFSEKARLDSSGRLLVGTSTASGFSAARMIINSAGTDTTGSANLVLQVGQGNSTISANEQIGNITFGDESGYSYATISALADLAAGSDSPGRLVFSTTANGASSPTERMRINNQGGLKVSSNGAGFATSLTNGIHEITSNNNGSETLLVTNTNNVSPVGMQIYYSNNFNNTANYFLTCYAANNLRAGFRSNGGLANYSANNVNLSDRNVKKDISPAAGTWDCLKEWEIVNFRYKDQLDDSDLNMGVIAQQIAENCPEVITAFQEAKEAKEAVLDEEGNELEPAQEAQPEKLGVKDQQMMWMAIKALQEAQTRIETLEQRLSDAGIA